jgi:hypothetical protein
MVILRIIFTILSALCLAALLPAGTFGGMPYVLICAGGAGVFFLLVLLCKKLEKGTEPPKTTADFLNPDNSKNNPENSEDKK